MSNLITVLTHTHPGADIDEALERIDLLVRELG